MNMRPPPPKRVLGRVFIPTVTLAHGGGGKAMKDLIDDVFISAFAGAAPEVLEDQARFDLAMLATHGDRLAFTTDSFVVDPLFFPGGDIGKLAVYGTVKFNSCPLPLAWRPGVSALPGEPASELMAGDFNPVRTCEQRLPASPDRRPCRPVRRALRQHCEYRAALWSGSTWPCRPDA